MGIKISRHKKNNTNNSNTTFPRSKGKGKNEGKVANGKVGSFTSLNGIQNGITRSVSEAQITPAEMTPSDRGDRSGLETVGEDNVGVDNVSVALGSDKASKRSSRSSLASEVVAGPPGGKNSGGGSGGSDTDKDDVFSQKSTAPDLMKMLKNGLSSINGSNKDNGLTLLWEAGRDQHHKLSHVCDVAFLPNDIVGLCRSGDSRHTWHGVQLYGVHSHGRPGLVYAENHLQAAQSFCVHGDVIAATDVNDLTVKFLSVSGELMGSWKEHKFEKPGRIAVTAGGRYIVPDLGRPDACLGLYSSHGKLLRRFGGVQLAAPWYVAVDRKQRLLATDRTSGHVLVYDADRGRQLQRFGRTGPREHQLGSPGGVAVDASNNILVADPDNYRVVQFSPDGVFIKSIISTVVSRPLSVAYDDGLIAMTADSELRLYQTYSEKTFL